MKLFLVAFAVIAAVAADVSHLPLNEYLPPVEQQLAADPTNEYLPPVQQDQLAEPVQIEAEPAHQLTDDGYSYKTLRRVVYRRNRRDVSHLASNEYLPPVQEQVAAAAPAPVYEAPVAAPVFQAEQSPVIESAPVVAAPTVEEPVVANVQEEAEPAHQLAADGYHYKTHRRVVYRRTRRDVSHLASNEYLPPVQEQQQVAVAAPAPVYQAAAAAPVFQAEQSPVIESAPVVVAQTVEEPIVANVQEEAEPAHQLADDGYHYKTHRRVVYRRNRRDVSHLASNEYLPPVQEQQQVAVAAPAPVYQAAAAAPVFQAEQSPVIESAPVVAAPTVEEPVAANVQQEAEPAHQLADDGYHYKTHRRVVYRRNRRDVSHLASNEYLPPVQEQQQVAVAAPAPVYQAAAAAPVFQAEQSPVIESAPVVAAQPIEEPVVANVQEEAEPAHQLADDGYHYKTHRRVVYRRNRRDVSHLVSNEYLPPVQQQDGADVASSQILEAAPVASPTNDYLPPVQQDQLAVPAPAHELADDGYHYKTNRRVVYRRNRRDVSHLVSNEYLPPVEAAPVELNQAAIAEAIESVPVEALPVAAEEPAPAHELADDGYRYKTHRRVVYRRNRRDVSHLVSNEYLPPVQNAPVELNQAAIAEAIESVPVEAVPVESAPVAAEEPLPAHELADDGYHYKTHRRVVYRRNRRDVSHLASNEYLPPVQQHEEAAVPAKVNEPAPAQVSEAVESAPVESITADEPAPAHVLADDGYHYKTHRRVVYRRRRRDVSHLVSNEYLPPVQQQDAEALQSAPVAGPTSEYLPPVQQEQQSLPVEEAAPAHELAADGYRYKTQRRVVYRRH